MLQLAKSTHYNLFRMMDSHFKYHPYFNCHPPSKRPSRLSHPNNKTALEAKSKINSLSHPIIPEDRRQHNDSPIFERSRRKFYSAERPRNHINQQADGHGSFEEGNKYYKSLSEGRFAMQRRVVKEAHRQVMNAFHNAWQEYFQSFREREMQAMLSFKQSQVVKVQAATERLQKRCETHRSPSPTSRAKELLRTQQLMMKVQDLKGLAYVRQELKKEKMKEETRRDVEVQRWRVSQELRLTSQQKKQYGALVTKTSDQWQDSLRIYLREQKRLKRKYQNYKAEMEHCHNLHGTTLTQL